MSKHTFVVLAYKESPYLEECVRSVIKQRYPSRVIIATSTPNKYIRRCADTYGLTVRERSPAERGQGAASDFNFALDCADTELVTIANHDDVYDDTYAEKIVQYYQKHPNTCIIFSKYYDIKGGGRIVRRSLNFLIKDILLWPLRFSSTNRHIKRLCLCVGNPIGCPAVAFVKDHVVQPVFAPDLQATFDYWAWEKLSRTKYGFGYVKERLMGHRIHDGSITSGALRENKRSQEELVIFSKFWPRPIAKMIATVYRLSERSNNI